MSIGGSAHHRREAYLPGFIRTAALLTVLLAATAPCVARAQQPVLPPPPAEKERLADYTRGCCQTNGNLSPPGAALPCPALG